MESGEESSMKRAGIYQIRNTINGKRYIGSTVDILRRWGLHRHSLRHNSHGNVHLQRSWDKYGEASFAFEILQILDSPSKEELLAAEQYWLNTLRTYERSYGYNILETAGNTLGRRLSQEAKDKLRLAHTGKTLSAQHRANIAASHAGGRHSPDTIEKIRQTARYRAETNPEVYQRFQSAGASVNARKSHCPQGHPYDEENTIHRKGRRICRTCETERLKRYSIRRRQRREKERESNGTLRRDVGEAHQT